MCQQGSLLLSHLGTVTLHRSAWPPVMCSATNPFSVSRIWAGRNTFNCRISFFSLNPYPLDRTRLGSSCTGRSGVAFCEARQGKKGVPESSYLFNHQPTVNHNFPTSPKVARKGGTPPAQFCPSPVPLLQSRPFVLESPGAGWVEGMSFPLVTRAVSISRWQSCSSAKLSCPTFSPLLFSPSCSKPRTFPLK